MAELYANAAESTLNGGIDDTVTTLTVDDASSFPASGDFRLLIALDTAGVLSNQELLKVTAVAGNDFTVERAAEPYGGVQTPLAHVSGERVIVVLTAGGLGTIIPVRPLWVAFTPEWYAANAPGPDIGDGSLTGFYTVQPNDPAGEYPAGWTLDFVIKLVYGSTTDGSGGYWSFLVPHDYAAGFVDVFFTSMTAISVIGAVITPGFVRSMDYALVPIGVDATPWDETTPGAWGAGDVLAITGRVLVVGLD